MKVVVFDTHAFERPLFLEQNKKYDHDLNFLDFRLKENSARSAWGYPAVCAFAHDQVSSAVLKILKEGGVRMIALRSAGFNHVDLVAAQSLGIKVARVPGYSSHAVAEHAVALMLALDRKICRASARVKELNFSLDGLVGFELHGKTVGIIGAGRIGGALLRIMKGFGCKVLLHDPVVNPELSALGSRYVAMEELLRESDIISLHLPLTTDSRHMIGYSAIAEMKKGVMLINTGRGGLVDTKALIEGLKSGKIGAAGLDVYEEEESVFFQDLSDAVLQDDVLARLLTFPNVLITAQQAFLTKEALENIVETTLLNLQEFEKGKELTNEVRAP